MVVRYEQKPKLDAVWRIKQRVPLPSIEIERKPFHKKRIRYADKLITWHEQEVKRCQEFIEEELDAIEKLELEHDPAIE